MLLALGERSGAPLSQCQRSTGGLDGQKEPTVQFRETGRPSVTETGPLMTGDSGRSVEGGRPSLFTQKLKKECLHVIKNVFMFECDGN